MKCITYISFIILSVKGQVILNGPCDDTVPVAENFDSEQFAGKWYEIHRTPNEYQSGDCSYFDFHKIVGANWTEFKVQNRIINNNFFEEYNGTSTLVDSAKFILSLDNFERDIDFWVLLTIYSEFALVYSCETIYPELDEDNEVPSPQSSINLWKLGRRPFYRNEDTINSLMNIHIDELFGIDATEVMYNVSHTDNACYILPEIEDGEDIIISGQCEDIPVLHNINYEAFSGLWHNLGSYDYHIKTGNCLNTHYTFNSINDIKAVNTRVIDEVLYTETSTVTIGDDGAFIFTQDSDDEPKAREIYLIDTDYVSYAISYNCENVGENQRRIYSQIMTRSRQLSEQTMENIDLVLNSYIELNPRYYNYVDQSDESCFYFPEPVENQPVIFRGPCDMNMKNVDNFNMNEFEGIWHVIEGYPNKEMTGSCINYEFNVDDENNTVMHFLNTQVSDKRLFQIIGSKTLINGVFTMDIDVNDKESSYLYSWVLGTDYNSYALLYSCIDINEDERAVWSWKVSRNKQMSTEGNDAINKIMDTIPVLDQRYYQTEDQSVDGCFFFPYPVKGEPVIFPGQCNENIAVVNNFDLSRFQGVWNEIAAYPKTQQPGKCIDLDFKIQDNNLVFTTSEVYDQFLHTSSGSLTFTSADSSAKFTANINIGGEEYTIPYWILATDYEDYALAYSCANINSDFRGIWSWKLSRTRNLSEAANTAINEVTSKVVVLGEEYYENTDHSDEACFYLPDLQPGEPVVIRGNCDPNIPIVNNFNKTAYEGLWYEIESYFDELQDGECQDATYKVSSSSNFNIIGSQVVERGLDTLSATAILSSDGTAKFEITTTRDSTNETITSTYWILRTDYTSYSLVYSCENLSPDERRVKSWKLSRQRQLSPEANEIINDAIDTIPVLHRQYYRVVDHSGAACFYYPEVTGQPVTFRGQCGENIPVVQNFEVNRYLGDWYDVESYPQFFQIGTCPLAYYSMVDDKTIEVINTEVVEQELIIATGKASFATDDGSAKLKVVFPGSNGGRESDYWILATDYDNYSLVYSCANISPDRRAVSTWKLSREATLSTASESAIDSVINTVDVLHQDYYVRRGHSENDCFYYPDNNGGPVFLEGLCSDSVNENFLQSFDANRFSGDWYEISRFPSELQTGMCAKVRFSNGLRDVTTSIINDERLLEVSGSVISNSADGYFVMNFPNEEDDIKVFILDTDYSEFALTYSCKNYNSTHRQVYSWKLGKNKDGLNQEANDRINEIVREHMDLFHGYYEETGQDNYACFHYPKLDNPSFIELPGPCNDTIQGIANFNEILFEGSWYEIARYPSELQTGECARFSCNVNNNNYIVLASSVKDQILTDQHGIGTVSSDGTGLLRIAFDVNNDVDYYILDTNYVNYALVYNCHNLPNGNRQVSSWKLSRNTTLDEEYEKLLAPVIRNTQGLLEEYYIDADQSEDSCFYIPDPNNDSPVIFRGQCDQNIRGVANFDIQAYLGWWHEIEAYRTGRRRWDCVSYRYDQIGGQFRFTYTEVFRETAETVNGTMVVTEDGRLIKTFNYKDNNGNMVEDVKEMLVLATDYNTYSLLYSCEDLDDGYRKVWSGKYSKHRHLTPEAEETMQPIIDSNQVLYDQFYISTGQSDGECFYYPEQHGPYVVLPGQCDQNIPVLRNFDLEAYSNTWFLIEDYPHPDQKGQCSGAIYNPRAELRDFRVRNFQLIGEHFEVEEGTGTLTSTDGSARMRIVREEEDPDRTGTETLGTEVFVLASDYESYSLVYTCRNIDEFHRYVGAWKLSRTRSLSSAGVSAINNLINQRQELYQPYFSRVRQDDDCPDSSNAITSTLVLIILSISALFLTN